MSQNICQNPDCTVAQTGTCIMSLSVESCPHYGAGVELGAGLDSVNDMSEAVLDSPLNAPRFPPSVALGFDDAQKIATSTYGNLIGILGAPDSGKTACLVSLYLLLSNGGLKGFDFASSKSLRAFDDLSRGARSWHNGVPEQMTAHTELIEGRGVGLLHLKLIRKVDGKKITLLIPDLPGEWTNSLVDNNNTERLSFLKSAQVIWIMVDGRSLVDKVKRRGAIHRARLLIQRVTSMFSPSVPNLHLVISRVDFGQPTGNTIDELQSFARTHGVNLKISFIASFSSDRKLDPGHGISELIMESIKPKEHTNEFWPEESLRRSVSRNILRIS